MRSAVTFALLLLAVGCSSVDDRPYTWGYISGAIFQPTCATPSCHSRAVAVAGLDFSSPDRGYASLTAGSVLITNPQGMFDGGCTSPDGGADAGEVCLAVRQLVIPYNPEQSRLINVLRARNAPRMPPDRPLTEPDITLIENWILDGARQVTPPFSTSTAAGATDGGTHRDLDANRPTSSSDGASDAPAGDGGTDAPAGTDAGTDARDAAGGQ
jgi:hypothetical protein